MKFKIDPEQEATLLKVYFDHIQEVARTTSETFPFMKKPIATFAIRDNMGLGYYLAVKSGLQHRIPHRLWAERLCNGPLAMVDASGANEWQSCRVSERELGRDYEPYWLGENPLNVLRDPQYPFPERALFVFPENFMCPNQERAFIAALIDDENFHQGVLITKSPLLLGEFVGEHICIL